MHQQPNVDDYIAPLLAGDRAACRQFVLGKLSTAGNPLELYQEVLWPAMERVERLYRSDRINTASEHMATRINRAIADQIQAQLPQSPRNGMRIVITCAEGEPEELGAQMCADLFESRGWKVYFLGGGVPNDEILKVVGQFTPNILLVFGTQPSGVPGVRKLVDMIREIGLNPTMNIMVSGGVFNRADGLWREVSADLVAKTAHEAIQIAEAANPREPGVTKQATVKRRRRRRRAGEPANAEQAA
jgi:methanogenic corrinoid protein MtbC1